jgi:hypothetical protein
MNFEKKSLKNLNINLHFKPCADQSCSCKLDKNVSYLACCPCNRECRRDTNLLRDKSKIQKARLCRWYLVRSGLKQLIGNEDIELAFVEFQNEQVGHIVRRPVVAEEVPEKK